MFIDTFFQTVIYPDRFPGRLLVGVHTRHKPECGVFCSPHIDLPPSQTTTRLPTVTVEGYAEEVFELNYQEDSELVPNKSRYYKYAIVSWVQRNGLEYPKGQEIIIVAEPKNDPILEVIFGGMTFILTNYGKV